MCRLLPIILLLTFAGCSEKLPDAPEQPATTKTEQPRKATSEPEPTTVGKPECKWRTVKRVIDGDTLELENGEKVRLIGVDTPETKDPRKPVQYFGKEAAEFTRGQVEGRKVWLEYDQTKKDKYGRTLAYVHYIEFGHKMLKEGRCIPFEVELVLNEAIIDWGYGHAYTKYPFKYMEKYQGLEKEARVAGRGLWTPKKEKEGSETGQRDTEKLYETLKKLAAPKPSQVVPDKPKKQATPEMAETASEKKVEELMDVIHATDGRVLKGKIVSETQDSIRLKMKYGEVVIARKEIARIEKMPWPKEEAQRPKKPSRRKTQSSKKEHQTPEPAPSVTVYVTRTGSKYHRAGCRYLRKSCIPMSLEDAKKRYSP